MRALPKDLLSLCLASIPLLATVHAVNLSQFQPISGFPPSCTYAYNAEINNCIASDFNHQRGCSQACIEGLQDETAFLQTACNGVSAPSNELIGKFLEGNGIGAICPQPVTTTILQTTILETTFSPSSTTRTTATSSSISSKITTSSSFTTTTSRSTMSTIASTSSSSSSSSSSFSTESTVSQAQSTSTSSTSSTSTSTVPIAVSISSGLSTSTTTTATPTFLKTAVNKGTEVVFTSKAEQTASNNPDAFGGGGSPFEIGVVASSASTILRNIPWITIAIAWWMLL